MGRVTITLSDRNHLALKLLALQKNEKINVLVQEALVEYLKREGGFDLYIESQRPEDPA
jgi:predicted transcriptional regulator